MSVVTHNRAIVPAIWPGDLGRPNTSAFTLQVTDDWRYIPETFDGICDWATVTSEDDESHEYTERRHLVYLSSVLPESLQNTMFHVTIVLQGFLGDFNISVLGNWKKREKTVAAAMQFMRLESGGPNEAFAAQVRALQNIRDFIVAKVGGDLNARDLQADSIFLQRQVFTKVRPYGDQASGIRLSNVTDPGGHARKISNRWKVDHIIQTGARRANGKNMDIAHTALRRGDFVEVSVFADIHVLRRKTRPLTLVNFAMKEVVKLWSAEECKMRVVLTVENTQNRFTRTDLTAKEQTIRSAKVHAMPSVFQIGGPREEAMEVA
ncbi:hypothetical protein PYCCODRAFT_1424988 [Trametes coccinea BRFM310]|uniref:Uncharacterized protein n=1 Tax=Trametes coccinea (strain BRFM310) TaxID=1353009 RepID=A0A1Y2IPT0_TRAC3|nr:hypothetical protein PYCCODRAFT_1424988 [Trametes coccinea BRFM310]